MATTPKKTAPRKATAGAKTANSATNIATKRTTKRTTKRAPAKPAAKTAQKTAPKTAPKPAPKAAPVEVKSKHKLVRDSFTIPKAEYVVLEGLKLRAADLKRPTKKSELIRAGIAALQQMTEKEFLAAVNNVPSLKTGRPKLGEAKK